MAYPPPNGILVSSSGVALERRASAEAAASESIIEGEAVNGIGNLGIGLIVALVVLAYWYRRVL